MDLDIVVVRDDLIPLFDQLEDVMTRLGQVELMILHEVGRRLLKGQEEYGEFGGREKDWAKEAAEELYDALVYLAARSVYRAGDVQRALEEPLLP